MAEREIYIIHRPLAISHHCTIDLSTFDKLYLTLKYWMGVEKNIFFLYL